jgi:hypothetical protein
MSGLTVEQLYFYPIKSLHGVPLSVMALDDFGAAGDRRWMIVDQHGQFVTQREKPQLARVAASLDGSSLQITLPGQHAIPVLPGARRRIVTIWRDQVEALSAQPGPDEALSDWLGESVALVYMAENTVRPVDPAFAGNGHRVSFADGFPFLVTHQASLNELSCRVGRDLDMRRFRPNIVVSGGGAFDEDHWTFLKSASGVRLKLVKHCARCVMTTVDPDTGKKSTDRQPLRELGQFRRTQQGVLFGMNAIHTNGQLIRVGDRFDVEDAATVNAAAERITS